MFLEKFDFDKDIEIYSNNSYYVDSDEEHYETIKKYDEFF